MDGEDKELITHPHCSVAQTLHNYRMDCTIDNIKSDAPVCGIVTVVEVVVAHSVALRFRIHAPALPLSSYQGNTLLRAIPTNCARCQSDSGNGGADAGDGNWVDGVQLTGWSLLLKRRRTLAFRTLLMVYSVEDRWGE